VINAREQAAGRAMTVDRVEDRRRIAEATAATTTLADENPGVRVLFR
jgi:hypothetical protein